MSDYPPPPPPPGSTPPPPPPPPPGGAPSGLQPVGPWPRLGARIIDGLVLLIPGIIIGAIIGGDAASQGFVVSGVRGWFANLVTTLVTFGYYVFLETSRGQTVGKMALGYKVIGPDGALPTNDVSMRRNAWMLLSIIPFLGGLVQFVIAIVIGVTISGDAFKRGWHDNFAGGSAVVRAR